MLYGLGPQDLAFVFRVSAERFEHSFFFLGDFFGNP